MKAIEEVIKTLQENKELRKLVKNISTNWYNEKVETPQITVTQISNTPFDWHDNKLNGRIVLLQVDVWSKGNPFIIAEKVIEVMKKKGYINSDERQLNEETINRIMITYKILES